MMAIPLAAVLLMAASASAGGSNEQKFPAPPIDTNCASKWKGVFARHTMCIRGDVGTDVPFDPQVALDAHNLRRGSVDPPATDMRKVYWDKEAAEVAAKWARQCNKYGWHDKYDARKLPSYKHITIGQNMAANSRRADWVYAVDQWYNEVDDFDYGFKSAGTGHYIQVVSKNVFRIGCGVAKCPDNSYNYICNYINGQLDSERPYTKGKRCGTCPGRCKNGLCDCGDTVCKYQSYAGPNCSCDCQINMSGSDCSKASCKEMSYCPRLPTSYCSYLYTGTKNFFRYLCPKRCGVC